MKCQGKANVPSKNHSSREENQQIGPLYSIYSVVTFLFKIFTLPFGGLQYVKELYLTVCHTWSKILIFLIQPIISLFSGVLIFVKAVVVPEIYLFNFIYTRVKTSGLEVNSKVI